MNEGYGTILHSSPPSYRRRSRGNAARERQSDTVSLDRLEEARQKMDGGPRQTHIVFSDVAERSLSGLCRTHVAEEHAALGLVLLRRLHDGDRHRTGIDLVVLHHRVGEILDQGAFLFDRPAT